MLKEMRGGAKTEKEKRELGRVWWVLKLERENGGESERDHGF